MEFVAAPDKRWANLAKRLHDTEHTGDDTLQSAMRPRRTSAQVREQKAAVVASVRKLPGST
jgi:hypothetical protein